jgi:hypothetical protein
MFVRVKLHLGSDGDVHILLRLYVHDPCVSGYCHFCARGFFVYARLTLVCSELSRLYAQAFLIRAGLARMCAGVLRYARMIMVCAGFLHLCAQFSLLLGDAQS